PANARTTPPQRSWPNAASTAATKVRATPMTVIWLGVTGMRPSAVISASARRRTQASNRVVNMDLLGATGDHRHRLFVDLDDLRRHRLPSVATGFLVAVCAHSPAQV